MNFRVPFILASSSPRRRILLEAMGFQFSVQRAVEKEKIIPGESPTRMVARLASQKSLEVAKKNRKALVLGADTTVVLEDVILGKPGNRQEAIEMLSRLSDRKHTVITAISLIHMMSNRHVVITESTIVDFAFLSPSEIEEYVDGGSPMDKAGGYGIQDDRGAFFVRGIVGDYYTVMGLPLHRLYTSLRSEFVDLIEH